MIYTCFILLTLFSKYRLHVDPTGHYKLVLKYLEHNYKCLQSGPRRYLICLWTLGVDHVLSGCIAAGYQFRTHAQLGNNEVLGIRVQYRI